MSFVARFAEELLLSGIAGIILLGVLICYLTNLTVKFLEQAADPYDSPDWPTIARFVIALPILMVLLCRTAEYVCELYRARLRWGRNCYHCGAVHPANAMGRCMSCEYLLTGNPRYNVIAEKVRTWCRRLRWASAAWTVSVTAVLIASTQALVIWRTSWFTLHLNVPDFSGSYGRDFVVDREYVQGDGKPIWERTADIVTGPQREWREFSLFKISGWSAGITAALSFAGRLRIRSGHCQRCGYNLAGNVSGICPECGTPIGTGSSA